MSTLSKNFRKIKIVSYVIEKKRKFFKRFAIYGFMRHWYLTKKWNLKFYFYSEYRKINNYLSNKYYNIKAFRPGDAFSDFDIAVVAKVKSTGQKVFIQIVINDNKVNGGGDFKRKRQSFHLKHKHYNAFHQSAVKANPDIGKYTIKTIEFNDKNKEFIFLVSEYRDFIPIKRLIKTKEFQKDATRSLLINQLKFYCNIFNELELAWSDPSIHNIMIVKDCKNIVLVPLDFVGHDVQDLSNINKNNQGVLLRLTKYILKSDINS